VVDKLQFQTSLSILMLSIAIFGTGFAQNQEEKSVNTNVEVPETKFSSEKVSSQERFDEVLSASRSFCGQRYPNPPVSNSNPYDAKDAQLCRRLELTGKRIECEVNYLGAQNAKGKIFAPETLPALKEWARCTGKVSVLLEEGYYVPTAEIGRRLQFCINQFYHNPGAAPKLGFLERLHKGFSRPDHSASSPPALDTNFFDKSSIRIDDQQGGLLKCQYMMPPPKTEVVDMKPPKEGIVGVEKNTDIKKSPAKKANPEVKKVGPDVKKASEPVVKKPTKSETNPVGECKRPKLDCPK